MRHRVLGWRFIPDLDAVPVRVQAHGMRKDTGRVGRGVDDIVSERTSRWIQLSDESLVDKMKAALAADGYRFRALVETIVVSPQFLNRRALETADIKHAALQPADIGEIKAYLKKGN